jgi:membrane protease YdiL (CAAX protease family)
MFLAVLLVIVPVEIGLMRRSRVRERRSVRRVVDLVAPRRRDLARRLPLTLAVAILAPGLVVWAEPTLHRFTSAALPDWWRLDIGELAGDAPWVKAVTLVGWAVTFVIVGPVVEELYFRGFLLPRIPARRSVAVVVNAGLFALYHLWQPHTWLTVFVFALPLAVVASRPRGVIIAVVTHMTVNAVAFALLLADVVDR